MIVVLEIPVIAPAKMLSIRVKPSICPTRYPTETITVHSKSATAPAFWLTCTSFLTLNSRPSENISRITPSSESARTVCGSATSGIEMCGPMIIPASR